MAIRLQRRHAPQRCTLVGLVQSANEAQKQLAMADRVILNKIDLVADETIGEIERTIRSVCCVDIMHRCIAVDCTADPLNLSVNALHASAVVADRSIR